MATLWHFLTRTLNVQGAVRRDWAQTHVLKRKTVKSVIVLLLNRRNSWRPSPIGCRKSIPPPPPPPPPVVDPADVTVLGQVESRKGDSRKSDLRKKGL